MGGGAGDGGGPITAAATAKKQKSLLQRVDTDVGNLVDKFGFLVNVARAAIEGSSSWWGLLPPKGVDKDR